MIQILLGIIALAIFGYLAIISIPVIGDSLTSSSTSGIASAISNQLQQVQGSIIASRARGNNPTTLDKLVSDGYLTSSPILPVSTENNLDWDINDSVAGTAPMLEDEDRIVFSNVAVEDSLAQGITPDVCVEINSNSTGAMGCAKAADGAADEPNEDNVAAAGDLTSGTDHVVLYMKY